MKDLRQAPAMTDAELRRLPPMVEFLTAATALGIGRSRAYEIRDTEFPIPVVQRGRFYFCRRSELLAELGVSAEGAAA